MPSLCRFQIPFTGKCGEHGTLKAVRPWKEIVYPESAEPPVEAVEDGLCEYHLSLDCAVCGAQATKLCDYTRGLVCGMPLCDEHDRCPTH
jgi:hypothetical protein